MRRIIRSVSACFATGGLVLLPLIITFGLLGWVAVKLNALLGVESAMGRLVVRASEQTGIPHYGGLILTYVGLVVIVGLIGWVARRVAQRRVSDAIEKVMHPFPVINRMYRSVRQAVETLGGGGEQHAARLGEVVLVRVANVRMWGLLSNRKPVRIDGRDYLQVFCPSIPVPATGFSYLVPVEDLLLTNVGFEALAKIIMSLGALVHGALPEGVKTRPFEEIEYALEEHVEE